MAPLTVLDTLLACFPLLVAAVIIYVYRQNTKEFMVAAFRMVVQLITVGYCLSLVFQQRWSGLGLVVLGCMMVVASVIAVRPLKKVADVVFHHVLIALGLSGLLTLAWVTMVVIKLDPIYQPTVIIPLAGMLFANCMNTLSLAIERYENERRRETQDAQTVAFNAAMIPQINGLLAVGVVSLPGMMTGQILSGVSPLIAVRYQIMVMSMIACSSALSLAIYFCLSRERRFSLKNPLARKNRGLINLTFSSSIKVKGAVNLCCQWAMRAVRAQGKSTFR